MNVGILTILALFTPQNSICQKPAIKAVYYDKEGTAYKIEEKHIAGSLITYISHFNDGSACLKRQTVIKGDTTIIKETSYSIFTEKTKLDKFQDCNSWKISRNESGDSVTITGYHWVAGNPMSFFVDSLFTGEAAKNSYTFPEDIKKARVPSILNNKLSVSPDSLIKEETVYAYYLKKIPVKAEVYDSKDKQTNLLHCVLSRNKMICGKYFVKKRNFRQYQTDTITWNDDTSAIRWNSIRFDHTSKDTCLNTYQITGTHVAIISGDSARSETIYLDSTNIFQNFLITDFIYDDVLRAIDLRYFERQKIAGSKTGRNLKTNLYKYDDQNRIIEQLSYADGELWRRTEYIY